MPSPLRQYRCPACGSSMTLTASHQQHSFMRDQYARCDNPRCGASYLLTWEIHNLASPPSDMFKDNVRGIKPLPDAARLIDLAHEFVGRIWQKSLNDDQKLTACADYLQNCIADLPRNDAEITAARAIADYASEELTDAGWFIDVDKASDASVIVNDSQGHEHCITLRELHDFIEQRLNSPDKLL